jgi:WD40 repeat protein
MNKSVYGILVFSALALMLASLAGMFSSRAHAGVTPIWSVPDQAYDIAISRDGGIVAAVVSDSEGYKLKVFDRNGMLWENGMGSYRPTAVAVSGSGNQVVVAGFSGSDSRIYFWDNAKMVSGTPSKIWQSIDLGGSIGPDALAITPDGNHVVAVGTGPNIFYWNNTRSLSGTDVGPTWYDSEAPWNLEYAAISDDGDVVLAAGQFSNTAKIYYYRNSASSSGSRSPLLAISYTGATLAGVAMSGTGDYFVAGFNNIGGSGVLYYFAYNHSCPAKMEYWQIALSDLVADVDLSHDGRAIAVATNTSTGGPASIMIITGMLGETTCLGPAATSVDLEREAGISAPATIVEYTGASAYTTHGFTEVSIDDAGTIVVAGTGDAVFAIRTSDGSLLWSYSGEYPLVSMLVEVSGNGQYAVSGGATVDSVYFFSAMGRPVGGRMIPQTETTSRVLLAVSSLVALAVATMLVKNILESGR